jgi:hypothetical protein
MSNILEEVNKLLGKGAIELVPPGQEGQGFYGGPSLPHMEGLND